MSRTLSRRGFMAAAGSVLAAGCMSSTETSQPTPVESKSAANDKIIESTWSKEKTDDVDLVETEIMNQATRIGIRILLSNNSGMGDRVYLRFAFHDGSGHPFRVEHRTLVAKGAMYGLGENQTEETYWFDFDHETFQDIIGVDVELVSEHEYETGRRWWE